MPEHPNHVSTRPKHVSLTDDARTAVQAWADREGLTFSAAIETLARLGLREDPRDAWGPALAAKVVGAVRADLKRYGDLLAATALDAGIAVRMASAAVKTLRPQEYPHIKQAARLDAVDALRRRDALAALGLPDAPPEPNELADSAPADAPEETPERAEDAA